jgi:RimJ/RimL family protein N-acetyltransferase
MSQWVFAKLGLKYLIAIVEIENLPSQRMVEKCEFTKLET